MELDGEGKRSVPEDVPLGFVPARWGRTSGEDGKIDRRHWELCLLLAAPRLFALGGRLGRGRQALLQPPGLPRPEGEVARSPGRGEPADRHPRDGAAHLDACREEMGAVLRRLGIAASRGATVKVQEGRLSSTATPRKACREAWRNWGAGSRRGYRRSS